MATFTVAYFADLAGLDELDCTEAFKEYPGKKLAFHLESDGQIPQGSRLSERILPAQVVQIAGGHHMTSILKCDTSDPALPVKKIFFP